MVSCPYKKNGLKRMSFLMMPIQPRQTEFGLKISTIFYQCYRRKRLRYFSFRRAYMRKMKSSLHMSKLGMPDALLKSIHILLKLPCMENFLSMSHRTPRPAL